MMIPTVTARIPAVMFTEMTMTACRRRRARTSATASTVSVEKVLRPPAKPVTMMSCASGDRCPVEAIPDASPATNDAVTLTVRTAHGNKDPRPRVRRRASQVLSAKRIVAALPPWPLVA